MHAKGTSTGLLELVFDASGSVEEGLLCDDGKLDLGLIDRLLGSILKEPRRQLDEKTRRRQNP